MPRVSRRHIVVLAILLYVTLDLSLPAMPGAFEFDPADSVESIQVTRARPAADITVVRELTRDALAPARPRLEVRTRSAARDHIAHPRRPLAGWFPPPHRDAAPASEDPH
jgi:hypothetical protein